jgi:hypothetical protein
VRFRPIPYNRTEVRVVGVILRCAACDFATSDTGPGNQQIESHIRLRHPANATRGHALPDDVIAGTVVTIGGDTYRVIARVDRVLAAGELLVTTDDGRTHTVLDGEGVQIIDRGVRPLQRNVGVLSIDDRYERAWDVDGRAYTDHAQAVRVAARTGATPVAGWRRRRYGWISQRLADERRGEVAGIVTCTARAEAA